MTNEFKRDLNADLALCEKIPEWIAEGNLLAEYDRLTEMGCDLVATFVRQSDAEFTERAREWWPEAIRRAIAAEAENERLREALTRVMHVSKWDGISLELDRCYGIARDALEGVTADVD